MQEPRKQLCRWPLTKFFDRLYPEPLWEIQAIYQAEIFNMDAAN